jgi:hypothetical protein
VIKIGRDRFFSPTGIFIMYLLISFLVLTGYRFIFPGEQAPLGNFFMSWRFILGVLDFIGLFPALAMSALVIPFGFETDPGEDFVRFSPKFLDNLKGSILSAIFASVLYGLLFFIVLPLAQGSRSDMRFAGELFRMARGRAVMSAAQAHWQEASQFLSVCENIWPRSPEMEDLRLRITLAADAVRFSAGSSPGEVPQNTAVTSEQRRAVQSATEALNLSTIAFSEERYYDAHWLATLASHLAKPGSIEAQNAIRAASLAWNAVSSLEPNARESYTHSLYRLKRDGYEAMVSDDWIRAYYIFRELSEKTPEDPDVERYLAMSEQGTAGVAFFIDEVEVGIGENLTGAVFSIPLIPSIPSAIAANTTVFGEGTPGGRVVMRFRSLTTFPDFSYAIDLELAAFDDNNRPLYEAEAHYAKLIPMTVRGKPRLVILLRALDRYDEQARWEPVWTGSGYTDLGDAQIALDITYEHFLRLSKAWRRVDSLYLADLLAMSRDFGNYGYIPQVFQAEILRRISEPVILLPLTILSIIIGWRFRAKTRPRYLGLPMLVIIPLVFSGVVYSLRAVFNVLGLWMLLSLGVSLSIVVFIAGALLFFILCLILLAAQHG